MNAKVLMIDDDPDFLTLIKHNLEQQGCEVMVTESGVEGLHLARTRLPNLILLDLMLPDLNGLVVCDILRSQRSTRDIPVFIVSALDELWFGKQRVRTRYSKYFKKPVDLKELWETVRGSSRSLSVPNKPASPAKLSP